MTTILYADGSTGDDTFAEVNNDADSLPTGDVILPAGALKQLSNISGKKGLVLTADDSPETLALPLDELDLIVIHFDSFTDGRGYSYARILRRQGYAGELRAVGDVYKDVLYYLKRSGFDSFKLANGECLENAKAGLSSFTAGYQVSHNQSKAKYQTGA